MRQDFAWNVLLSTQTAQKKKFLQWMMDVWINTEWTRAKLAW